MIAIWVHSCRCGAGLQEATGGGGPGVVNVRFARVAQNVDVDVDDCNDS